MTDASTPKKSVASTSARAVDAEGALGRHLEPAGRYLAPAVVAAPVAAVLELGQRALELLLGDQEAVPDADVVAPADGLARAVADALAEPDAGPGLGGLGKLGKPPLDLVEPAAQEPLHLRVLRHHGPRLDRRARTGARQRVTLR